MKVIDLLNRIANDEEIPLKIKVKGYEYRQSNGQFWCDETEMYLIDSCTSIYHLNDEVEVIEEDKKIEKLNYNTDGEFDIEGFTFDYEQKLQIVYKINEIIDHINRGDKE